MARTTSSETVVDLTPRTKQAKVVREGFAVPAAKLDETKSQFFVDNLPTALPKDEPRVVSQSVKAGTNVPPGTTVDLILAPTHLIPFDIFENPHKNLMGKNINVVTDGILQDSKVRQTLLKFDNADDVPQADKAMLINEFKKANVNVDEAAADTSFGTAFDSMRAALAFK